MDQKESLINDISIEFLRDEVRCGFYIPTAIKQAWAGSLSVLSVIDQICDKHGINYFAEWGTLLGAVRHGGFVPWDDDLDIGMLREDYERFRKIAQDELPEGFGIQDFRNQEEHWLFITRVVNTEHICFEEDHLNRFQNFPYIASIDIFVLDYLYRDEKKEKERCDLVKHLLAIADGVVEESLSIEKAKGAFRNLINKEIVWDGYSDKIRIIENLFDKYGGSGDGAIEHSGFRRDIGIAIYDLVEKQMAKTGEEESERIGQIFPWGLKGGRGLPKEFYRKMIRLPFEETTIPVPCAYGKVLQNRYGDYFTIHKVWSGHDYPYFEGQKKNLEEVLGYEMPEYKFDRGMPEKSKYVGDNDWPEFINELLLNSDSAATKLLFLAAGASRWKDIKWLYDLLLAKGFESNIKVVPLPVVRKDAVGRIVGDDDAVDAAAQIEKYPKELNLTEWWDYDIRVEKPDVVFIQDPYDGENPVLTIPVEYYTSNIRKFAGMIIYLQPFMMEQDAFPREAVNDVYNLKHYVLKPGIVYADNVVVQSDEMKNRYVEKLIEWAGQDTEAYWNNKIIAVHNNNITQINLCNEDNKIQRKKKLLYLIGVNELYEHGDNVFSVIRNKLSIMKQAEERLHITVYFYPECNNIEDVTALINEVGFDCDNKVPEADNFDAYYGSPSPFVVQFIRNGKPVMIASYDE